MHGIRPLYLIDLEFNNINMLSTMDFLFITQKSISHCQSEQRERTHCNLFQLFTHNKVLVWLQLTGLVLILGKRFFNFLSAYFYVHHRLCPPLMRQGHAQLSFERREASPPSCVVQERSGAASLKHTWSRGRVSTIRFGLGWHLNGNPGSIRWKLTIWDSGPNGLCLEYPGNNIFNTGF